MIDLPKEKHLNPAGHLLVNIAGYLLAKIEVTKRDARWVTEFQEVLVEYFVSNADSNNPSQNLLSDLSVVSLNYDRVFEHFISNNFYEKMVGHSAYNILSAGIAITFSAISGFRKASINVQ